ncbi:hypothetical protein KC336_g50 [Hortaea werneckii]|nr:hypothetical protein KC336_g50 [Hortaea werneckii]
MRFSSWFSILLKVITIPAVLSPSSLRAFERSASIASRSLISRSRPGHIRCSGNTVGISICLNQHIVNVLEAVLRRGQTDWGAGDDGFLLPLRRLWSSLVRDSYRRSTCGMGFGRAVFAALPSASAVEVAVGRSCLQPLSSLDQLAFSILSDKAGGKAACLSEFLLVKAAVVGNFFLLLLGFFQCMGCSVVGGSLLRFQAIHLILKGGKLAVEASFLSLKAAHLRLQLGCLNTFGPILVLEKEVELRMGMSDDRSWRLERAEAFFGLDRRWIAGWMRLLRKLCGFTRCPLCVLFALALSLGFAGVVCLCRALSRRRRARERLLVGVGHGWRCESSSCTGSEVRDTGGCGGDVGTQRFATTGNASVMVCVGASGIGRALPASGDGAMGDCTSLTVL